MSSRSTDHVSPTRAEGKGSPIGSPQPKNPLGHVAQSYFEHQSLPALFKAARRRPAPKPGSDRQAVRAIFPAVEVVLVTSVTLSVTAARQARCSNASTLGQALHRMVFLDKNWFDMAWCIADITSVSIGSSPGHRLAILVHRTGRSSNLPKTENAVPLERRRQIYKRRTDVRQDIIFDLAGIDLRFFGTMAEWTKFQFLEFRHRSDIFAIPSEFRPLRPYSTRG